MSERSSPSRQNRDIHLQSLRRGLFAFLAALILSGVVIWGLENLRKQTLRDEMLQIATENTVLLHQHINQRLALIRPFAAMIQQNGRVDNFESIGATLLESYPHVSEIALAPDGIIRQVVPLAGNEKAIGLNLLTDPKQKAEALLARETRKLTLAGPLHLAQGGVALVGRLPVFKGAQEEAFWGFVLIVIRFPDILDSTALGTLGEKGFQYTLSRVDPTTGQKQIIASSDAEALDEPVVKTVGLPNGEWMLSIAPIREWHNAALLSIELILGLLFSLLLAYIVRQYVELRLYRHSLEKLVEQRTSEIAETRNRLHTLLDTIPDLVWLKNRDGVYLLCNPMFERFFGAKEAEIAGRTDYDFVDRELADSFRRNDQTAMEADAPSTNEEWITFADDGHRALMETVKTPMYDEGHALIGILGVGHDITQRRADEMKIKRLSQIYATLSQCNQAIIHEKNAHDLFEKICRHSVVLGGFSMTWIGLVDPKSGLVRPAASYGEGQHYLERIEISTQGEASSGRGPTGIAIREDRPYWCQDFMNDPATAPWHARGAEMGWNASAALPFHRGGNVIGAFMIYSKTPEAFDAMSQKLLVELTQEISFAIENFDRETKRRASETRLLQTERLLEEMSEMAHVGGWEFDPETGNGSWTKEVARIHDMEPGDPTNLQAGLSVYESEWLERIKTAIDEAVRKAIPFDLELQMTTAKGNRKWVRTIGVPVTEGDKVVRIRGAMQEITARKSAEEKVQWFTHFDPLTGLPNRTLLNDRVEYAIRIAHRAKAPITLIFLDLDHFKNINDALGHHIGDLLLVQVASRIRSVVREEDTISRQGGDEFVIMLPGTGADGAAHVARKLIDAVSRSYAIRNHDLTVTPSIGIALYPIDGKEFNTLLGSADAAMYRAKHDGRNCYRFFTPEIQERSARNLEIENALRGALERNELNIYYQPQIALKRRRLIGAEALLRWSHPTLGAVSPAEFIPIAEESGQIIAIGAWVLRRSLMQLKSWLDSGMEPFILSVNLSAIQFRHPQLLSTILTLLDELQLPAERLELELTERVAMEAPLHAIERMNELHEHGIRMSIDDFGTGYSSLSYLRQFHISKLKIDQSFIREIAENPEDRTIVNAIINMAHNLNMQTIAEGVETAEQLAFLEQSGCDEIQGFFFSKPLPAAEFEAFVHANAFDDPSVQ